MDSVCLCDSGFRIIVAIRYLNPPWEESLPNLEDSNIKHNLGKMTRRGEKGLKHNEMIHLVNPTMDEGIIFLDFSVDEPASFFYCFSQFELISATRNQRFLPHMGMGKGNRPKYQEMDVIEMGERKMT